MNISFKNVVYSLEWQTDNRESHLSSKAEIASVNQAESRSQGLSPFMSITWVPRAQTPQQQPCLTNHWQEAESETEQHGI